MSTFLTKGERKHLSSELSECLTDMSYEQEQIENLVYSINQLDNTHFYQEMVNWMPDCMDDLRYLKECLTRRGLTLD